jgi:hypothetical protein
MLIYFPLTFSSHAYAAYHTAFSSTAPEAGSCKSTMCQRHLMLMVPVCVIHGH